MHTHRHIAIAFLLTLPIALAAFGGEAPQGGLRPPSSPAPATSPTAQPSGNGSGLGITSSTSFLPQAAPAAPAPAPAARVGAAPLPELGPSMQVVSSAPAPSAPPAARRPPPAPSAPPPAKKPPAPTGPVVERMETKPVIPATPGLSLPLPSAAAQAAVPAAPPIPVLAPGSPSTQRRTPAAPSYPAAPPTPAPAPAPARSGQAGAASASRFPAAAVREQPAFRYDRLPRTLQEMEQYDRLAMEPYPNYNDLSMYEKARIYSSQFEYMHGRKPTFSPDVVSQIRASAPTGTTIHEANQDLYKTAPFGSAVSEHGKMETLKGGVRKDLLRGGK